MTTVPSVRLEAVGMLILKIRRNIEIEAKELDGTMDAGFWRTGGEVHSIDNTWDRDHVIGGTRVHQMRTETMKRFRGKIAFGGGGRNAIDVGSVDILPDIVWK